MPDISMCANKKCKIKKDCYRFMAKPNPYRQSYLMINKSVKTREDCNNYWALENKWVAK